MVQVNVYRSEVLTVHIQSRAYNNMCYLIGKYAPIDGVDSYDPSLDPFITGAHFGVYSASD